MRKVMYPGSFDPITIGHLDLIERSSKMFDHVVVALMVNDEKHYTFTAEQRKKMVEECVSHLENVTVALGSGLTVDFAQEMDCSVLIRGIRAVMDYEAELQQATANRTLNENIETLFLVASPKYSFISSSIARTVASYGGELRQFVPHNVEQNMRKIFGEKK
ncbi:MAG: pantetheine-phosphate adenylyltransferase [Erysipelothrix sp.]|nr:pantetheine-phosphate adenylyltransferase [Erysipelothrix sp.]